MLDAVRDGLTHCSNVIAIPRDVTDKAHRQAVAAAAQDLGDLEAVVNNTGVLGPDPQPHLLAYPLDVLEQVYRVNVIAPLGVLQTVRDQLKPDARVINITSDAASRPTRAGVAMAPAKLRWNSFQPSWLSKTLLGALLGRPGRYAHVDAPGSLPW